MTNASTSTLGQGSIPKASGKTKLVGHFVQMLLSKRGLLHQAGVQ